MKPRELWILRHAKSAWDTEAPSDYQRPLNQRGQKAAVYMGEWIANKLGRPDCIISSPALRAWETAVIVSTSLKIPEQKIDFRNELYLASNKHILKLLSSCHPDVKKLVLIGHNPGLEELLGYLVCEELSKYDDGKILPTATLAQLELRKNWQHLEKGCGKLLQIKRPK